jgi:hypothetical protein
MRYTNEYLASRISEEFLSTLGKVSAPPQSKIGFELHIGRDVFLYKHDDRRLMDLSHLLIAKEHNDWRIAV